jgi:hypothetical protein
MSTNVEGINYGSGTVLNGLTTPGGLSYVWAWDTTNSYVRFFDGSTAGGRRMAFYSDLPGAATEAANLVYAGPASGAAATPTFRALVLADMPAAVTGALEYQGAWNASTNSPSLASGTGTKGYYYKVSVAGTTTLDGISTWNVGDSAVFDGTTWDKLDGESSPVLSVAGRTGAVTLAVADVSGAAPLASPTLTGTPAAPTAAVNTNTTQLATTAFVLGQAATATPIVDGTGAAGSSTSYARADHVHPTDTSRLATAGGTITGALAISDNAAGSFSVGTANDLYIDSTSNHYLLLGTATAKTNVLNASGAAGTPAFQKYSTAATGASFGFIGDINSGNGPAIYLAKGRSSGGIVTAGDTLGNILFNGSDGTNYVCGAELIAVSEGTPGAASMAARLAIFTNRAANTATEAARFDSSGNFSMGGANIVVDANRTFYNRAYTLAGLPSTGLAAGQQVACSNLGNGTSTSAAGGVLDALECDGTNWRWSSQAAGPQVLTTATGSVSWTPLVSSPLVYFNTALTGAVTLTLGTGTAPIAAWKGMRARIVRGPSATGAFNLTVNNGGAGGTTAPYAAKVLSAASSWADFEFDGTNWYQTAAGSL